MMHNLSSPTVSPSVIEAFEQRRLHAFNKLTWSVPDELKTGRMLDIGCGIGNGIVAALQAGFGSATGIDRDLREFSWFDPAMFEAICNHYDVSAAKARLLEADIFQFDFGAERFDVVLMLDSIEHVPEPMAFIDRAASLVAAGGVLLIDTCPLYFSTAGGHLFGDFPPEEYPWVHLRNDFHELCRQRGVSDWSMQRYRELNRVTHDEVRGRVEMCGLSIIQEHRSSANPSQRALLEENRSRLNLSGIAEHLLFEDWILVVGQRQKV